MKTYMYDSGLSLLTQQETNGLILSFTGFTVSSGIPSEFVFDSSDNTPPGTVQLIGGTDKLYYCPMTADEVLLRCEILSDTPYLEVEAVQLSVNNQPFCVSIAPSIQKKMEDTLSSVGTRYVFQLIFSLPGIFSRISFSNLATKTAIFHTVETENDLTTYPWEEIHDQIFVKNHSVLNRPLVLLNVFGRYWGCPLTMDYTDSDYFKIDGGVVGDRG